LRGILGSMPVAAGLAQGHGVNQPDPATHELGKWLLGTGVRVTAEQFGILDFPARLVRPLVSGSASAIMVIHTNSHLAGIAQETARRVDFSAGLSPSQ